MGDFNHADIICNYLDSYDDGRAFLMLVQDCFLTQHISKHIRSYIIDTKINDRQCESDRTIG